ncbi:RAMP superfamily CRISPR-associated protein [Roseomonas sp. CAU 1739]|uniref:RAMP superfamily CRISPR-associated protein n=1 Tax=Roseomonas sp. CAU 1739 TaxID=3140364 RepID=UPI00325BC64A
MITLLLDGTITAVSPIAIILPGSEDRRTPAGAPRKRLLRNGEMVETVYVPPSSLRGRLRHLLTSEVMRLQHEQDGRVFTPENYIDTALGGVKDRKAEGADERLVDLAGIRQLRERNPIVSLFGSMVSRVAGRLMVGDLTPLDPVASVPTGRSVRADPFVRNPAVIGLLDKDLFGQFTQLNALRTQANRDEDQSEIVKRRAVVAKREGRAKDDVDALEQEAKALAEKAAVGFKSAGGAVNIQQLLDGYDVIPEGTVMAQRTRLLDATETEVALLLLALHLFAQRPLIGGHTAHGCGEVMGSWELRVVEGGSERKAGSALIEPFAGLSVESEDGLLKRAMDRALNFKEEALGYDFRGA